MTQNLQKTNGDKHLKAWVRTEVESGESELSNNEQQLIEDRYRAQISNFGIPKIERLEGNIGYVDIRVFHRPSWRSFHSPKGHSPKKGHSLNCAFYLVLIYLFTNEPTNAETHAQLATCYPETQQPAQAEHHFRIALEIRQDNIDAPSP